MNNKTDEIILKADGSAVKRTIHEHSINVVDDIINELSSGVVRVAKNIAVTDAGLPLHLILTQNEAYVGSFLPSLTITAPWKTEGYVVIMQVEGRDQKSEHPVLSLPWEPSPGMALLFLCRLYENNVKSMSKNSCYLISYDADKQGFYLPLPNIYEDASLCMGEFNGMGGHAQAAYQKAFNQLANAQWNADLLGSKLPDIQALFRLKVAKKGGKDVFEAIPCENWKDHCRRCETPVVELGRRLL